MTGLKGSGASVTIAHAARVTAVQTAAADLVVVGGPTHGWSMTRPSTRRGAVDAARKSPEGNRHVEQDADVRGLREWIADVTGHAVRQTVRRVRHAPPGAARVERIGRSRDRSQSAPAGLAPIAAADGLLRHQVRRTRTRPAHTCARVGCGTRDRGGPVALPIASCSLSCSDPAAEGGITATGHLA